MCVLCAMLVLCCCSNRIKLPACAEWMEKLRRIKMSWQWNGERYKRRTQWMRIATDINRRHRDAYVRLVVRLSFIVAVTYINARLLMATASPKPYPNVTICSMLNAYAYALNVENFIVFHKLKWNHLLLLHIIHFVVPNDCSSFFFHSSIFFCLMIRAKDWLRNKRWSSVGKSYLIFKNEMNETKIRITIQKLHNGKWS